MHDDHEGDIPTEAQPRSATPPTVALPPKTVGPYRVLRKLGEGGMGEVYEAEQTAPVRRRVALKLIKAGYDTKEVVARFESERQALAIMDHPNIARVFDAGATEMGRPFFVMEYVDGEPITDYCDRHRLGMRQRLELFARACEGVQHAHLKGIIHRDLKPSNVLVQVRDDRPVPKIIDFGVAKATNQRLTEQTLFTQLGQLVGTPEYMSPEQAEMTTLDIDARTDVYSLGAMLYELLVGALPFESRELRKAGFDEIRRRIREVEPPKPSTRVSSLGEDTAVAANRRGTDANALQRQLRGELDWITMKALEKDRTRRYNSPAELAADIGRHLRNEPVEAGPPSVAYRARKFVRRHRVAVGVASGLVLLLVAFAITMTVQAGRIARERDRAETEAAKATAINEFMLETLGSASPWEEGHDVTVVQALDDAVRGIDASFGGQPLTEAAVRHTVGTTYYSIGRFEEAEPLLLEGLEIRERELGPNHDESARSRARLGQLYWRWGKHEEAEPYAREVLEIQQQTKSGLHPKIAESHTFLARVLLARGEFEEAERHALEAQRTARLIHGEQSWQTADTYEVLSAIVQGWRSDYQRAGELTRIQLEILREVHGGDALEIAMALNNLAVIEMNDGDFEAAISSFTEALEIQQRLMGDEHPEVATTLENLGGLYFRMGRYDESLALLDQVIAVRRTALGEDSAGVARTMTNQGSVYRVAGRTEEAVVTLSEAVERMERAYGSDHPDVSSAHRSLGTAQRELGDLAAAEASFRRGLEIAAANHPDDAPTMATHRLALGSLMLQQERYREAEPLLVAAHHTRVATFGADDRRTLAVADRLIKLYDGWGRPAEAATFRERLGSD